MKYLTIAIIPIFFAGVLHPQSQPSTSGTMHAGAGTGATTLNDSTNLPAEPVGANDLIGITVYDSPELTRTVRIEPDGTIRLPMLQKHIKAAGLNPEQLEKGITSALVDEQVLVDPIVTVSVLEYRSRPINVVGAVRTPMTLQAVGTVTLLDALALAGGLADNAGQEIMISRQVPSADGKSTTLIQRISIRSLYDAVDPSLNVTLHGGEIIRVPEAGSYFVIGNVRSPGAFQIKNGTQNSVLTAMALSGGLNSFTARTAYIYRTEAGTGGTNQLPVELKKIMTHKAPDVPLMANDVLYVPEATGRKTTRNALVAMGTIGITIAVALLYIYR